MFKTGSDNKIQNHVANSVRFYFLCDYAHSKNKLWSSVGANCIVEMLVEQTRLSDDRIAKWKKHKDMKMTANDIKSVNYVSCTTSDTVFHD